MAEARDRRIQELSKGNQQKIQFIATVVAEPEILILDEPFSGLDPVNVRLMMQVIRELAAEGRAILLSTHQMGLVESLCQRACMVDHGRRVLYGDLDEIRGRYSENALLVRSDADYSRCDLVAPWVEEHGSTRVSLREGVRCGSFCAGWWRAARRLSR